jgi:hypothetical protein
MESIEHSGEDAPRPNGEDAKDLHWKDKLQQNDGKRSSFAPNAERKIRKLSSSIGSKKHNQ